MRFDVAILGTADEGWSVARTCARAGLSTAMIAAGHDPASSREAAASVWRDAAAVLPPHSRRAADPSRWRAARDHVLDRLNSASVHPTSALPGVTVLPFDARLITEQTLELSDGANTRIEVGHTVLALGHSTQFAPQWEQLLRFDAPPTHATITGDAAPWGSVASWLANWGTQVTWRADWSNLTKLCSREAFVTWQDALAARGITLVNTAVESGATPVPSAPSEGRTELCLGETGAADDVAQQANALGVASHGVSFDEHGRAWCDGLLRTWSEHVSAIGSGVSFPAWARWCTEPGAMILASLRQSRTPVVSLDVSTNPALAIAQRSDLTGIRQVETLWTSTTWTTASADDASAGRNGAGTVGASTRPVPFIVMRGCPTTEVVTSIEVVDGLAGERLRPLATLLAKGATVAEVLATGRKWPSLLGLPAASLR